MLPALVPSCLTLSMLRLALPFPFPLAVLWVLAAFSLMLQFALMAPTLPANDPDHMALLAYIRTVGLTGPPRVLNVGHRF